MTPPDWVEAVTGLIGMLTAMPVRVSRRAITAASYLGISFAAAVTRLWDESLAQPLRELARSKLRKIKSTDIADAAEAHNKALLKGAQAEETKARAEELRSRAKVNEAEARAIDGRTELERLDMERRLAEEQRKEIEARLAAAIWKLKAKGGGFYLNPPEESK